MSPKITDLALELFGGAWTYNAVEGEQKKHQWIGFDVAANTTEPMFAFKRMRVSDEFVDEYEVFTGMPYRPIQIAELSPAKFSVGGSKWYSEVLYSRKDTGFQGFKGHMSYTKLILSPFDGREYRWNHPSLASTFYLEDVETKEILLVCDKFKKDSKPKKVQLSSRVLPHIEFWLLAMMHYVLDVAKRRKEALENVTEGLSEISNL